MASAAPGRIKPGRIFISYARGDDPEFVRTLHQDLLARARATGERGLRVFFDKQDMPSRGKSFLLEIRDFIGDSETERVLLVVGPRAIESTYVQAEWRAALQRCVIVVPLLRLGRPRHENPRDARRVDEEDYGSIPAEIRETRVHAVDFRKRRGALPGRRYADALEELWRILAMPTSLAGLGSDVPDLPGNCVPRTDYLAALGRLVLPDADAAVTVEAERRFVVLSGMGGVGKSVLAAGFCRACKTRRSFEHGIAWVRMGPRPELPVELVDVLGPSRRAARAGKVRAGLQDLSCLIVLDDVTDPTHVARFKNAIGEGGRLLVTTRDGAVATALNAQRCDVDLLSDAESLQLLADWSGHAAADLPREALDALAECGRLPLAVSMIGAMMRGKPRDRWRNVLADLRSANLDEIRHRFPNYDHPDLLRALKVSVDGLEGPKGDPGFAWERKVQARRRYLELAIFPGNTPLPLTALHRYWAPAGVGEPLAAKLADLFVERNLARRDESGRLVLHDLQRDYIVSEQRVTLTVLNRRFLDAHRPQSGWPTAADDGYLFGHLADHLRAAGLEQELNGLVSRAWMDARFAASGSHRGFADDVEVVISAGAEGGDLVTLARDCLVLGTVAELATGATPTFIGAMARNGEVDKAIHNASLIADKSTRVYALGDVCVVLMEQGGLGTAQRVVEQLLEELERSEGSEEAHWRLQLLGFSWAARCLAELRRPEPAAAAAARALALLDARIDTHVRVRVLDNVSRTFLYMNRRLEARRFARRAFKAARGPSSSRTEVLRDAAILLIAVGDESSLSTALALLQHKGRVVGHEPAEALLLVAEALAEAGQKKRAAALVQSVRAAIPDVRDRGLQAALISSIALTLGRLGQGRQAEALSKRALSSIGRPRTRHMTLSILHNTATLAIALGQKARAIQLARRALNALPADPSPERLTDVGSVAQVLSDAGRREEASAVLGEALAAAWVIRDPLRTRDTAGILGEALIRVGKVDQGVAQISDMADVYGVRGRAQQRIALVLAETGAWDAAVSLAESTDELYRPEALRRVANVLVGGGARERARSIAAAIDDESTRALCLCEIVPLDDESAVGEARRAAETVGDPNALGILAVRLAVQVSPAAGPGGGTAGPGRGQTTRAPRPGHCARRPRPPLSPGGRRRRRSSGRRVASKSG